MFSVDFYREEDGSKPVGDFIRTLDVKMKAKVVSDLHRLEMLGNEARSPLNKYLEDDIFELRTILGNNIVRILYFFDEGETIILVRKPLAMPVVPAMVPPLSPFRDGSSRPTTGARRGGCAVREGREPREG